MPKEETDQLVDRRAHDAFSQSHSSRNRPPWPKHIMSRGGSRVSQAEH
jgi:hypothetical protein